ncbi:MAG: MBOAT family protein [Bacteroides sp.]|nr:MBOAT family protein [Bacteroides sp.]MCM1549258.1 MBOAT family protein [Clostridium sp.]
MLFSSTTFLFIFLPVVLAVYFVCPKRFRNLVLLIGSLLFYAWGEPRYILVMLATILVNYILALVCASCKDKGKARGAKAAVIGTILFSIGMLAFFKYSNFFLSNLNGSIGTLAGFSIPLLDIALPLGISFYTFQTLSYTIDVYRGTVKPQRNLLHLATYVCLFPQLIAGPIVRYETVAGELEQRQESFNLFASGVRRFVTGLGKKVLLANTAGSIFQMIGDMGDSQLSVALYWMASIAYTFQIYFDFSGYSDMAIGLGRMFGFQFLENFDYPYCSKSITEFWRRWHMSLSSWFRDYIYIPLGGNRKGRSRTLINLCIVWFLTGFWHGASWNFIIWGLYFFVLLMIEKAGLLKWLEKLPQALRHIYTMFLVNLSWVIFSYDNLGLLGRVLRRMFGFGGLPVWNRTSTYVLLSYLVIFLIMAFAALPLPKKLAERASALLPEGRKEIITSLAEVFGLLVILILATSCLASDAFNPFLYFRF